MKTKELLSKVENPPVDPFTREKRIDRDEVLDYLRKLSNAFGSQKKLAKAMGIGEPYLSEILKGRRELPAKVLDMLKMRRVELYERNGGTA